MLWVKIAIELPHGVETRLREQAVRYGIPAEVLAQATLSDLLEISEQHFDDLLDRVLEKNEELYRRLG